MQRAFSESAAERRQHLSAWRDLTEREGVSVLVRRRIGTHLAGLQAPARLADGVQPARPRRGDRRGFYAKRVSQARPIRPAEAATGLTSFVLPRAPREFSPFVSRAARVTPEHDVRPLFFLMSDWGADATLPSMIAVLRTRHRTAP